jgi:quinol monooxygenase YgiN
MAKVAQLVCMKPKPGKRQALIDALAPAFEKAEREAGTELYIQLVDAERVTKVIRDGNPIQSLEAAPDEVWYFELYDDRKALRAHDDGYATSGVGALIREAAKDLLAEPHVCVRATPIRAKGVAV